MTPATWFLLGGLLAPLVPVAVQAQDQAPAPPDAAADERPTGLPSRVAWTFNFDAGWGSFGFANSLFANPREGVQENLSDQWFEGYVKPALSASYTLAASSQIYGKVSAVGERTYGSVPDAFGQDVSSFGVEDLSIGWRSGKALAAGEHAMDFEVGRARYRLGHGMLLFDGAAEGGSRGGYWTNARQAFEFAAIGRVKPGHHTIEAFYLDKDELEEYDTGTRLWGANYEFSPAPETTLAATYLKVAADRILMPERDGLQVFNLRAYTAPFPRLPQVSFEFEYATEQNGDALDADAWTLQGAYEFGAATWTPVLSYRYARFQGDDPATRANEAFDPLLPGFSDWGTWWQGEIAASTFLANSNLVSHLVRAHVDPTESLGAGLMLYGFRADQPESYGPGVADRDIAFESDAYADWKVNQNFTVSLVLAYADPGKAVQQATGRTRNFAYGMVYVGYSF